MLVGMCAHAAVFNFYAPWCPWCQRLEPTWEAVTAEVHKRYPEHDGRIRFGKVGAATGPPKCGPASGRAVCTAGTMFQERA